MYKQIRDQLLPCFSQTPCPHHIQNLHTRQGLFNKSFQLKPSFNYATMSYFHTLINTLFICLAVKFLPLKCQLAFQSPASCYAHIFSVLWSDLFSILTELLPLSVCLLSVTYPFQSCLKRIERCRTNSNSNYPRNISDDPKQKQKPSLSHHPFSHSFI